MEPNIQAARQDPRLQSLIHILMERLKTDISAMYEKLKALPMTEEEEGNCLTLYLNNRANDKVAPRLFQIQKYQTPTIHMFLFREGDQNAIFERSCNDWPTMDEIWRHLRGESIFSIELTHGAESINTSRYLFC